MSLYWRIRRLLDWHLIKRRFRLLYQRLTRGWADSDTWALDLVIAKFALPRLKRFRELNNGHPCNMTEEAWNARLDDMIYALTYAANEDLQYDRSIDLVRVERGLRQFGKYFLHLWW